MRFDSRRSDVPGYLEFIWRTDVPHPDDIQPQAIAIIVDADGAYHGMYGLHTVTGSTVADVKRELIALIEAGQ